MSKKSELISLSALKEIAELCSDRTFDEIIELFKHHIDIGSPSENIWNAFQKLKTDFREKILKEHKASKEFEKLKEIVEPKDS